MPVPSSRIHLVVPGLFGPMPGLKELGLRPDAPLLETLLARADVIKINESDLDSTLFDLFHLPRESGKDLPTASICRQADGGEPDGAFWMHADPVFLKPGSNRLVLFDAKALDIRSEDAEDLARLFNQHFKQDGWWLEAPHLDRWYLRLPAAPDVVTHPLADVIGRNINPFLPTGGEAMQWRSALNEVQMLFHSAAANMQRETDGLMPINSIWFSGGGHSPEALKSSFDEVIADIPLARGLVRLSETACTPLLMDSLAPNKEKGERLVVYHHLLRPVLDADPQGWVEAVEQFEIWAKALQEMIQKKQLGVVEIYPCNGSLYRIDKRVLRRFWKARCAITA